MRSDGITKALLAMIAVGLWALVLSQASLPTGTAYAGMVEFDETESLVPGEGPATSVQRLSSRKGGQPEAGLSQRAPTATLPLRWQVSWATEQSVDTTHCGTAVVVTNRTSSAVDVEVEWFDYAGDSLALRFQSVEGFSQKTWITGDDASIPDTDSRPFYHDDPADIADIVGGFALVNADDPRIQVAAFQYCRDGQGAGKNITSITQIPVSPVGTTAEFFLAGMPATRILPMTTPEVPE